jgi:hypothetical protein
MTIVITTITFLISVALVTGGGVFALQVWSRLKQNQSLTAENQLPVHLPMFCGLVLLGLGWLLFLMAFPVK